MLQALFCSWFVFFTIAAHAQLKCDSISNYHAAISCAEKRSPEMQKAGLELERARRSVDQAGQWQNPELSADAFHGKLGSENSSETEINISFPIALGGKIAARTSVAQGMVEKAEANLNAARVKLRSEVILKLHRLRQLLHEQEVAEEAISTFSKLVGQYAKRIKLSPEQEISVAVFRMSKSDYELKKAQIFEEFASLDSYFKLTIGSSTEGIKKSLPTSPKSWPKVESQGDALQSPQLRLASADVTTARAELEVAQSESWPTVTLGPSLKLLSESGQSSSLYGFNLSLPIPVFNMNGSGRALAASVVTRAETIKNLTIIEQNNVRDELVRVYQQSVTVLNSTLSHDEIERKHTEIERYFLRGVVPSALVIEAHRTVFDLERSRNERELKALENLLTIYVFDGKTPELF